VPEEQNECDGKLEQIDQVLFIHESDHNKDNVADPWDTHLDNFRADNQELSQFGVSGEKGEIVLQNLLF
jgi:hypothetical protein